MKLLRTLLITVILLGALLGGYLLFTQLSNNKVTITEDDLIFSANFDTNIWYYTIQGDLPNPCYTYNVEEILTDQIVTVNFQLINPAPETICTSVTEPITYTGTIEAGKEIEFIFNVNDVIDNDSEDVVRLIFLNQEYLGENLWSYTVFGELPSSCYSITEVSSVVLESYPEQVHINVLVDKNDSICNNETVDVFNTGTVPASEQATFSLKIDTI